MKKIILSIFIALTCFQAPAFAYLDPGTGSMLLSALIGIVATAFFMLKTLYYKLSGGFLSLFGVKLEKKKHGIVFYSEGKSYWRTFKPVLEVLDKKGIQATYLTSSQDDEGLQFQSNTIDCKYIGEGNKAYTQLNMLEADICVMTTPGLDVLQIQRSKGVKHYSHVVHAPTDAGLYKLYSFDYYDSVLCSGQHQVDSLRYLEQLRGTEPKLLTHAGCPYMDVLAERLDKEKPVVRNIKGLPHVLIAPTWGNNGLLKRFGLSLLKPLAEQGYSITIRPHPQSFVAEPELMDELQSKLSDFANVQWDRSADNFDVLANSDIMISDLSGVIFDYAFVFEKPVITMQFEVNLLGTEANDLPNKVWELQVLDKIGKQISVDELNTLPELVQSLTNNTNIHRDIITLRDASLFNYRHSGEIIAQQLINIQANVNGAQLNIQNMQEDQMESQKLAS
ncbi:MULTISPECIES: CDP-glycerol glycerophosphotransferase family protein [unclassified Photobacterium]|uniref:CDP-glycerol glycerophosphotransferase family protein n=1 Tax=unclassified Photobacterium TaxID=2628852 RepID=UPI001EDFD41F|nr:MULTISPECIES: CDP-glycerol glycerophosphotransferase family protein [unclassified Photobacterium]MCG3865297.1 CDP-glycerol glycerophosphotransferase family protein [Photobacterium sp. Ph6]MCG3876796.1 CDP-glycerol glycerophosphotransferase family protein [Photobacterium sp. Ph5]